MGDIKNSWLLLLCCFLSTLLSCSQPHWSNAHARIHLSYQIIAAHLQVRYLARPLCSVVKMWISQAGKHALCCCLYNVLLLCSTIHIKVLSPTQHSFAAVFRFYVLYLALTFTFIWAFQTLPGKILLKLWKGFWKEKNAQMIYLVCQLYSVLIGCSYNRQSFGICFEVQ